jgi:hypothetical protein
VRLPNSAGVERKVSFNSGPLFNPFKLNDSASQFSVTYLSVA